MSWISKLPSRDSLVSFFHTRFVKVPHTPLVLGSILFFTWCCLNLHFVNILLRLILLHLASLHNIYTQQYFLSIVVLFTVSTWLYSWNLCQYIWELFSFFIEMALAGYLIVKIAPHWNSDALPPITLKKTEKSKR